MNRKLIAIAGAVLMSASLHAAEVTIHYNRLGSYEGWKLWAWNADASAPGFDLEQSGADKFGAVFRLEPEAAGLSGARLGLLPRKGEWADKDAPDRFAEAKPGAHYYLLEGDPQVYTSPPEISTKITGAWLDGGGVVRAAFNRAVTDEFVAAQKFYLAKEDAAFHPVRAAAGDGSGPARYALLAFDSLGAPDHEGFSSGKYLLHSRDFKPAAVGLGGELLSPGFGTNKPLGAVDEGGATTIRVFAPAAQKVEALVYAAPGARPEAFPLSPAGGGAWEKKFEGRLDGKYYRLRTLQGGKTYEGLDPYAGCVTGDDGLALIGAENTPVSSSPAFGLDQAVLYEVHLRDLTMDPNSGVKLKGKYLGAAESGTRHPRFKELTTGLDHIAELGVNAVHILPFQDFANGDSTTTYDWGYMPVNFNSPEGAYATRTDDLSRVREAKTMIDAFHKKGLKVIMDVVYNHTAETRDRVYNFNALAMDYYYRVLPDGRYSNGSGCGNEFNTEAPMARRFLVDSLLHWVREYKVDGFRFDLMGLIDLDAVAELVKALKAERPNIIIYGEPWAAGATPTNGVRKGSQRSRGYAVFSDDFRDALKGSVFNADEQGYVQAGKNRAAVMTGIRGSVDNFTDGPLEVLNYVSCHDNHTLWDRIERSAKADTYADKVRMDKLANAVVLTSQGIPFLHAGEEFLRSKRGEHNSYNLPDEINRLDWTLKKENVAVFGYYKALIALRRAHPAFRLKTAEEVRGLLKFYEELDLPVQEPAIAYVLDGASAGDSWTKLAVLINPGREPLTMVLPAGEWRQALDEFGANSGDAKHAGSFVVPPISIAVLYQ